jgi:hypothetical protein
MTKNLKQILELETFALKRSKIMIRKQMIKIFYQKDRIEI